MSLFKSNPEFEFCKSVKTFGKSNKHGMLKKILRWFLNSYFPEFINGCPFSIQTIEKINKSVPPQFLAIIPNGIFRIQFYWFYKNKDVMLNVSFLAEVY